MKTSGLIVIFTLILNRHKVEIARRKEKPLQHHKFRKGSHLTAPAGVERTGERQTNRHSGPSVCHMEKRTEENGHHKDCQCVPQQCRPIKKIYKYDLYDIIWSLVSIYLDTSTFGLVFHLVYVILFCHILILSMLLMILVICNPSNLLRTKRPD